MDTNSPIYIVNGYHPFTPIPEKAIKTKLNYRFALILDTYPFDVHDIYFKELLLIKILVQVSKVISYDSLLVVVDDCIEYQSIEDFSKYLSGIHEDDRQPPQRIEFRKNGNLVCIEETEFWYHCGGPAPYGDSYTLSFYTMENLSDSLQKASFIACELHGIRIDKIIQASLESIRLTWWRKLLKKLKRQILFNPL